MLGSSCRNSCLVLISSPPIFARLHLDQWVWTRHWFPPKWWSLSWTHPKVIPAKTAKVGSAQNPGRPSHVTWMTKEHTGLWLEKWLHGKCGLNLTGWFILCYPQFQLLQYIDVNITRPGLQGFLAYPELLPDADNSAIITRERTNGAFKYTEPDEVPRKWVDRKSRLDM